MMTQTQIEKDYVSKLKKLIIKIQEESPDNETLKQLGDAKKWICYGYNDRLLLDELIKNAEEYLDLELKVNPKRNYTKDEYDRFFSLIGWFNEISSDLKQYDTTLYQIYYCIKNPFSQFTLKRSQLSN